MFPVDPSGALALKLTPTWFRFSGSTLSCAARERSTKANSPLWESMKPMRSDSLLQAGGGEDRLSGQIRQKQKRGRTRDK